MNTLIHMSAKALLPTMALLAVVSGCDRKPDPAPEPALTFRSNSLFCDAYNGHTVTLQRVTSRGESYLYEVGDVVGLSAMPQPHVSSMHWEVHCEEDGVSFENVATLESMLAGPPGTNVFLGDPTPWSLWTVLPDPLANPQELTDLNRFYYRPRRANSRGGYMTERNGFLHMTEDCGAASMFRVRSVRDPNDEVAGTGGTGGTGG
ncbi:MAG: hypothetical protein AAF799_42865 [Myxococcota bacterium]